jgi:hypothetical protein
VGSRQSSKGGFDTLSSVARLKEHRNSMLAAKGRDSRRERTFVGSECAVCDEPLEHMLRGERVLQLSCGHVSHEACFYEYIKEFHEQTCPTCEAPLRLDTSRGGGIDFENLNRLVRSTQTPDPRDRFRETVATPTPSTWDHDHMRQPSQLETPRQRQPNRNTREHLLPDNVRDSENRFDKYQASHARNVSGDTGMGSATEYAERHGIQSRQHDYDVQSMETSLSTPRNYVRNPIPVPTVTVRSEFPTLSKSRQQQSLTCLITVEVVDGKWQPQLEDLPGPPAHAPGADDSSDQHQRKRSNQSHRPVDSVHEQSDSRESMEKSKEELCKRVDNWHGLDPMRFGRLILFGNIRVGKDRQSWQDLECYLFTEMLICVKEKKVAPNASQQWDGKGKGRVTLKGSILIKRHLKQVEHIQGTFTRILMRLQQY